MYTGEQGVADEQLPLQPRTPGCLVPLTAAQRRHWKGIGEGLNGSTRSVATGFRILGPMRVDLLRESLRFVVHRHESLRSRIVRVDGSVIQEVDAPRDDPLEVIDLSHMAQAQAQAHRLALQTAEERVDLSRGPLFHAKLLRVSSSEHVLALTADHMISDGMSSSILAAEVWSVYDQLAGGTAPRLPPLDVQFGDYAVWQQRTYWAWRRRHEDYWRERLLGAPFVRLPLGNESPAEARTSAVRHIPFGKALSDALRETGVRHNVSLPLVILGVYAGVMSRWCDQRDLPLILVTHGRDAHDALKHMVAFLASCLHLRLTINRADSFLDLLRQIATEYDLAKQHHHFDRVWDFIPGCTTDLYFNWVRAPAAARSALRPSGAEDIRIRSFPLGLSWQGKLHMFFSERPGGVNVSVAYDARLVRQSVVDWFEQSLREFALCFARNPEARISSVEARPAAISGRR